MASPVVVTGASGFIGSALVRWLRRQGVSVIALTRSAQSAPDMQHIEDYATFEPADGTVLVHLAQGRDNTAVQDDLERDDMVDLCRTLAAKNWRHVVFASTAVVYGDREAHPRRPDEAVAPQGAYAQTKLVCENAVLTHGGCVLRLTNIFGPGMARNNVISDILSQIPGTGNLTVRDDVPVRDFLWVEDAAACLGAAATTPCTGIYNVATGHGTSVHDLAQCALNIAGESERPIVATHPSTHPSTLILDIDTTSKTLNWHPSVSVKQGLETLLKVA